MNALHDKRKGFLLIICLLIGVLSLPAQGIGSWRTHLPFYDVTDVVETPNKVFAVASGSLLSYSPDDQEIKKYGKYDGLNDSDIQFITYSEEAAALLIAYSNCNVDIMTNKGIYNFHYILDQTEITDRKINGVDIAGKMAYISTSFGIVELDLVKMESPNSYATLGNTFSSCLVGEYLYIATNRGIYKGLTSKNLSSPDNWEWYDPNISSLQTWNINRIVSFQGALIFHQKNGAIFFKTEDKADALSWNGFRDVRIMNKQLVGVGFSSLIFWTSLENKTELSGLEVNGISGRKQGIYWIAQNTKGLGAIKKEAESNEYTSHLSNITINSPISNYVYSLSFQQSRLLVSGGGAHGNRYGRQGIISILENGKWTNVDTELVSEFLRTEFTTDDQMTDFSFRDVMHIAIDPKDPNHYFVSTYGEGLYEFQDHKPIKVHNRKTSIIETVIEIDNPKANNYVRLGALTYDKDNNLFITCTTYGSAYVLYALTNNGNWVRYPHWQSEEIAPVNALVVSSKNNHKWLCSYRYPNLYILDDNKTLGEFSDDKTKKYSSFTDQKGEQISFAGLYCLAEDKKGAIWMGTDKGPVIFYNPQNAIMNPDNFYCTRPVLPYNDGTDTGFHLLDNEQINAIAVDGANRKWLGTERSGVYLVSENGMEVIHNFTLENSPLLSNKINSIAIDSNTGEVFFATEKGLVSYMGDASEGKESYSEVRAYPNPVRPEHQDKVTVINLMQDSSVKITDAKGKLVYQGTSKGGMFTWQCIDNKGERVKTGIYLVFAARPDGSEGVVTKIMVVR